MPWNHQSSSNTSMNREKKKKFSNIIVRERGKSFDEELDDLKLAIRKMQKARSRKSQEFEKKKLVTRILPPSRSPSSHLSISTTSPSIDMKWLKEFREKNASSPCPKENLERIKKETSASISTKRERKDEMQKRLTELFAMTFSSSKSRSFDPSIGYDHDGYLFDTVSGDNMINEIPTLSAEDTLSTTERKLMDSESLSEDICHQISSDSSLERKAIKPIIIPQKDFTRHIVTEDDDSNLHPQESPRKVLKSKHFFGEASLLKNGATYQSKPHFSHENISVSGNLYSFRILQ